MRSGRRGWRFIVAFLLFAAIFAGWTWRVRAIEVTGPTLTAPGAVRDVALERLSHRRWWVLPRTSIPFTGARRLSGELRERFAFATVTVDRQRGGVLAIRVTEQPTVAIAAYDGHGTVLIGTTGQAIASVPEGTAPPAAPEAIMLRLTGDPPMVGVEAIPPSSLSLLQTIWQELRAAGGPLTPATAMPRPDAARSFDIQATGGARVTVSAEEPTDAQAAKLRAALAARPSPSQRAALRSIDLRYGDRVFLQ